MSLNINKTLDRTGNVIMIFQTGETLGLASSIRSFGIVSGILIYCLIEMIQGEKTLEQIKKQPGKMINRNKEACQMWRGKKRQPSYTNDATERISRSNTETKCQHAAFHTGSMVTHSPRLTIKAHGSVSSVKKSRNGLCRRGPWTSDRPLTHFLPRQARGRRRKRMKVILLRRSRPAPLMCNRNWVCCGTGQGFSFSRTHLSVRISYC